MSRYEDVSEMIIALSVTTQSRLHIHPTYYPKISVMSDWNLLLQRGHEGSLRCWVEGFSLKPIFKLSYFNMHVNYYLM